MFNGQKILSLFSANSGLQSSIKFCLGFEGITETELIRNQ